MVDLPGWVAENVAREQFVDHQIALGRYWSELLADHDPALDVVFAREGARPPLVGGRWHVRRRNLGVPDSYMPITTPDGGYREPDSGVLNELQERSLWRTSVGELLASEAKAERAGEKARELWREQAKDEVAANFRAAMRVPGESLNKRRWATGKPKEN